jgi:hypothetical protein
MTLALVVAGILFPEMDSPPWDSIATQIDSVRNEMESTFDENMFDQVQSEEDELRLLDELEWRRENPFDLNDVTVEELETLPGVLPSEASAFLAYRDSVGSLDRKTGIRSVPVIGPALYRKISQYVAIRQPITHMTIRTRTMHDLQPRLGARENIFIGPSVKSYTRMSFQSGKIQTGLLFEKDAGERFGDGFVSGYASARDVGPVRTLILGDFAIGAGQGLVLWRGRSFGKGSLTISNVRKADTGIRPYRSTDEFNFFRGAGVQFGGETLVATLFYSRRTLDATISIAEEITGFYEAGYFRTSSELEKRKAVKEGTLGGRIEFGRPGVWTLGSTAYASRLDMPVLGGRAHDFSGTDQRVVGIDGSYAAGVVAFGGELARARNQSYAGVLSAGVAVSPSASVVFLYRNYSPAFINRHAGGFGERSTTSNERGFYVGATVDVSSWLRAAGYLDHFTFPWRTFLEPLPTTGNELALQADATISPRVLLNFRITNRAAEETVSGEDLEGRENRTIVRKDQQKYRLTLTVNPTRHFTVKGRVEHTGISSGDSDARESGYLIFQDLRVKVQDRLSLDARLIFFHTDSYASRVYEFESDLSGVFSNPALYGKGRRWYIVVRYEPADALNISARYSETQKEGVTLMGSGLTEIRGDRDNRVSLQLDVRF